ncbi:cysteine-rich receptor-like protein kinase [Trifolium medium]|uniref:Cysteine-rich receptor-like protein kinase n=1 Tax=Trifolium medium TaxID=97028 RepID=A0A392PM81_9FABA|nr:cysteine-rich receptor-like protein kinase [Trifolium medium]
MQTAQLRGLTDHCPLLLSVDDENWGLRPLRMLKCWQDVPGYKQFVISKWQSLQIDGWGGFVLKQKLKLVKLALKEWDDSHSSNVTGKIDSLKSRLSALDCKAEEEVLSEEEVAEMHGITSDIHSLSRINTSICCRRRSNALSSIMVDGVRVEGMSPIHQAMFSHFSSHFRAVNTVRPTVDDLQFRTLSFTEGGSLVKPFSVKEVKAAV